MLGAPQSFSCSCSAVLAVLAREVCAGQRTPAKSAQPTGVDMLSLFVAKYVTSCAKRDQLGKCGGVPW